MRKTYCFTILALSAVWVMAQETASPSPEEIMARIEKMRSSWSDKVADELAKLPEDVQKNIEDTKNRIQSLGQQIKAIRVDTLSSQDQKAAIKQLIAAKKTEVDLRITAALQKIDEYRTTHKNELEKASDVIKHRIESNKKELEEQRAEIEKQINEKRLEIDEIFR